MKQKLVALVVVSIALAGCTIVPSNQEEKTTPEQPNSSPASQSATIITPQEVAKHDKAEDCWIIIDTGVYDVTNFIDKHPGGKIISLACGKDASTLYHARGPRKENHSQKADQLREQYRVGTTGQ